MRVAEPPRECVLGIPDLDAVRDHRHFFGCSEESPRYLGYQILQRMPSAKWLKPKVVDKRLGVDPV